MTRKKDHGTDNLLALDGDRYFVDHKGDFEVVFKISKVDLSPERPHGLKYALSLLDAKGDRVVGFDNAHVIDEGSGPGKKKSKTCDHKHIGKKVTSYKFENAMKLLEDFWSEVDKRI